jgi:hypothetical protein
MSCGSPFPRVAIFLTDKAEPSHPAVPEPTDDLGDPSLETELTLALLIKVAT